MLLVLVGVEMEWRAHSRRITDEMTTQWKYIGWHELKQNGKNNISILSAGWIKYMIIFMASIRMMMTTTTTEISHSTIDANECEQATRLIYCHTDTQNCSDNHFNDTTICSVDFSSSSAFDSNFGCVQSTDITKSNVKSFKF